MIRSVRRRALLGAAAGAAASLGLPGRPVRAAAAAEPRITILDGAATVLAGAARAAAQRGLPLADTTIVETGPETRLLRIEWPGGVAADLGPDTRLMLAPPGLAARNQPAPLLSLLQGWLKLSSAAGAAPAGVATRAFELPPFKGVAVMQARADESWLFVESGRVAVADRHAAKLAPVEAGAGAFYLQAGTAGPVLEARATSAQLQRVPQVFRDTLPLRFAEAAQLKPQAQALPAPTYAQLQPWLTAEPPLRRGFTTRFRRLLRDRTFRRELDKHLAEHPEWRPILYPPPPPPPPSAPVRR